MSLLCVPYKILEKLIYARVEPLIDPLLPEEQDGFQRGKSTVDQGVLLIQNIKNSFASRKKAGVVFVNLTAAYDTIWHCGLIYKFMELVPNRSFTLTTGDSKQSRQHRLENSLPQRSVLAKDLKETLTQEMTTLSAYLQTWKLKLSHSNTVTAAFHLNNRETKRELKVYDNNRILPSVQPLIILR